MYYVHVSIATHLTADHDARPKTEGVQFVAHGAATDPRILQSKINIQQKYTRVFDMLLKMNVNSQHIVEGWLLFLSIFIIMIDFERV